MKSRNASSLWTKTLTLMSGAMTAICLSMAPQGAKAENFNNVVIIGDSLSDTGNLFGLSTVLLYLYPGLFPEAFPMSPPYAQGRFSNGPVWIETLAYRVDHPAAAAPAGFALGPTIFPGYPGGGNYSIAGALAGTGGSVFGENPPTGLKVQAELYLQQHGGAADPGTLYVVVGGGNDVRVQTAAQSSKKLRDAALQAAAQSYRDVIKRLADAGAKTFVVANVPDFGVSPEAIYIYNKASAASDATRSFNRYADRMLERLAEQQDLTLARVDFFGLMDAIIHDATYEGGATFGITNVNTPCLDVPAWFAGGVIPGAGTSNCNISLWADYHHPTAKVLALMGHAAAACRINRRTVIATTPDPMDEVLHSFCDVLH